MWQVVLQACGAIIGVLILAVIGWAAANFQKWTGIQLSDQQRQIINDAATMIANAIKVLVAQGIVKVGDLQPDNPNVHSIVANHMTCDVSRALAARGEDVRTLTHKSLALVGADHGTLMLISAHREGESRL